MRKIYSFFGVDHKCGTSMLCQSVAELIAAERPSLRVLLIHAEGDAGTGYTGFEAGVMERMHPALAQGLYDVEEMLERSVWKENLSFIAGADPLEDSGAYRPQEAEAFFRLLKSSFDLILSDSGSRIDHGLALGSLFAADGVFLIASQNESALRKFERLLPLYIKLELPTLACLINRFSLDSPYSLGYIRERLCAFGEPFYPISLSPAGPRAETRGESLLQQKDRIFADEIRMTANLLLVHAGLDPLKERMPSPWMRLRSKPTFAQESGR